MELVRAIVAAGVVLIPGLLAARALGLGIGTVERLALGCALGRILLGGVVLSGVALGTPWLPAAWCATAWAAGLLALGTRARRAGASLAAWRQRFEPRLALGVGLVVAASLLASFAIVGRSGLLAPDGTLVFVGRHPTWDSLVYTALAAQARSAALPLPNPFVTGVANLGHSVFFAELAGLGLVSGLDAVDVAFRLRPALDVTALVLTAFALARRLGATPMGALLGALLVLLGGGLSQPIFWLARAFGVSLNELEIWSYGTSYLVPFNPVAPGAQTAWSALLLLSAGAVSRRTALRAGIVGGLLLASVFELKATLWLSFLPAVVLAAWTFPAGGGVRSARIGTIVALLVSLPLVLASPGVVPIEGDARQATLRFCLACLPRFSIASAFQDPSAMARLFDVFDPSALASPRFWLGSIAASALYLGVTLGARLLAWPVKARSAERSEAAWDARFGARVLGLSLAIGAAATCLFHTPPHFVNAGQFAWCASLGAWPLLGVRLGRWIADGRIGRAALLLAAVLPSGVWWIVSQGAGAPVVDRVTPAERALAAAAAERVPADAVVLEPTLLLDPSRASPIAWLAGRRLYASKEGMVAYLAPAERERRTALLQRVYRSRDRAAAEAALAETGARFLVRSPALGDSLEGSPLLRPLFANEAGTLDEVVPGDRR